VPAADQSIDVRLGSMVGGFLILHAFLHPLLALTLSTSDYVVAGRLINLATLVVGGLCLSAYVRRQRRLTLADEPQPSAAEIGQRR
jgi:hypothetical protein